MQLRLKDLLLLSVFGLCFYTNPGHAGTDQARVHGMLGFGSSATSNEIDGEEGPLGMSFGIEYAFSSRWMIGAEHIRSFSMSPAGSSISFTGISMKYYYPGSIPTRRLKIEDMKTDQMVVYGFFPYFGLSSGFGQASLPSDEEGDSPNAGGIYLGIRAGIDYPFMKSFGIRSELGITQSVMATGTLSSMLLSFGLYYFL